MVIQLIKKFPAVYETLVFIVVFTRAHHWFASWIRWFQSNTGTSSFCQIHFVFILPPTLVSSKWRIILHTKTNNSPISSFLFRCFVLSFSLFPLFSFLSFLSPLFSHFSLHLTWFLSWFACFICSVFSTIPVRIIRFVDYPCTIVRC
jgi:hypothetical protein